jgi:4-hydroxybenzoate polyprenyltransferase
LVFAAFIFSIHQVTVTQAYLAMIGFVLLCLTSGTVYIVNDFLDRERDRLHPVKKNRPMAAGEINPYMALVAGLLLLAIAITVGLMLNFLFGTLLISYVIMSLAYSVHLKTVVILDVMIIAFGFVLRAVSGGVIIGVPLTPWFLLCTMLLALFLAVTKRRHELYLLELEGENHRQVLAYYSPALLDQFNSIVTTAAIISYALFTFTSGQTVHLMWTVPVVIYGVFRYLYLVHIHNKGGSPEEVLLEDRPLQAAIILYTLMVVIILYWF